MSVFDDFKELFSGDDVTEPELQAYMELHTELIPTPMMLGHDLQWNCVISKFEISRDNIADFAYITKNSGHWRFVFIELERPQKRLFIDEPHVDFHSNTRQAIAQIEGWKSFFERNSEEVFNRMRPLLQPRQFLDNPFDIQYVLIIGRNQLGKYPTREHSGRIKRLAEDSQIHLCTYDSISRMGAAQNVGHPKNILVHHKATFAFKAAQADTNIFAWYNYPEIEISDEHAAWFASRGYDMEAWRRGERLSLNHKLPESREGEFFELMIRDMKDQSKSIGPDGS